MKKIITMFLILSISIFVGKAQSIINGDFETWQSVDINEPTGAVTANLEMFHRYGGSGQFLVTKVTDSNSGMYACKAETQIINNDTTFGYVVFGKPEKTVQKADTHTPKNQTASLVGINRIS